MTNKQAKREIDFLDWYLQNHTDDYGEESHAAMMMAVDALEEQNENKWIPITTRPMEENEKPWCEDGYDGATIFDCPLPEDGQEVLISYGEMVMVDVFIRDEADGCYFEGVDIGDVEAWMPLPEPYKMQESEVQDADCD